MCEVNVLVVGPHHLVKQLALTVEYARDEVDIAADQRDRRRFGAVQVHADGTSAEGYCNEIYAPQDLDT
jgi:hypothetical protein